MNLGKSPNQEWGTETSLPSILLLEDGHYFIGESFGFLNSWDGLAASLPEKLCGEICFNTSMSGYQEVLSDPSYAGQMITFSFPHIGNVGCNPHDYECDSPHARAMIVRERPTPPSSWRSESSLQDWLCQHQIAGIAGIDTRALIHHLREHGSMRVLLCAPAKAIWQNGALPAQTLAQLHALLLESPSMEGQDLTQSVTCLSAGPYVALPEATWLPLGFGFAPGSVHGPRGAYGGGAQEFRIAVWDFGIKKHILQMLRHYSSQIRIFPARSSWEEIAVFQPHGLFLSNGPGDPAPVAGMSNAVLQKAFALGLPVFGICLGHQLLALSLGARTIHMHHGHRGLNHPVWNLQRQTVEITSQNHGFCVEEASLPPGVEVTHRSLFDQSIEGIRSTQYPAFSVQYHPESSPGPHDSMYLFGEFAALMKEYANACI